MVLCTLSSTAVKAGLKDSRLYASSPITALSLGSAQHECDPPDFFGTLKDNIQDNMLCALLQKTGRGGSESR